MADAYSTKIYNQMVGNGSLKLVEHLSASASAGTPTDFVGPVTFRVAGDLGGGTAAVQALVSGSVYRVVQGTSATAAADTRIDFPTGSRNTLQTILTGGAAASCDMVLQGFGG